MTEKPTLAERAVPLKQASPTSGHQKNVRHGRVLTLHISPAQLLSAHCLPPVVALKFLGRQGNWRDIPPASERSQSHSGRVAIDA